MASTIPESLAKWSAGKRIEVTLMTGDRFVGRLGTVASEEFVVEPDNRRAVGRSVRFADVRSVRGKMTTGQKWAIAGGIYAGVTVLMSLTLGK